MFWKLLITAVIVALAWRLLTRPESRRASKPPLRPRLPSLDLTQCDRCGTFRRAGTPCDCSSEPGAR